MKHRHHPGRSLLLAVLLLAAACSSTKSPKADERPELGRISPLGLGQPDPEVMAERAFAAWKRGDLATFLSGFAFVDPESDEYAIPDLESGPFAGVTAERLEPLRNSLFPLARLDFASPVLGEPRNVRNIPPTVEVPIKVERDFDRVSEERRQAILTEVNVALRRRGLARVDWETYRRQVESQPAEIALRFVHVDGLWRFDGGPWRP